jgi:hypothetical protein
MTLFRTLSVLAIITLFSCNSGSKATNGDGPNQEEIEMIAKKMKEAGFYSGTIIYSDKEGDCAYTIDVDSEDYKYLLDPINLEERYQTDGAKIWFKFAGLKMMNRCEKANPVSIVEIQDRM